MEYNVELFGLDGCHEGYTVYIKGKKNFYNFLEQYKEDIKEKNINRYIQYKNHYVIYNKDIIQKFGLYAIYEKIPYLKRGEKTYKDNKYYYIYFYKTLIVKLDLDKLQEIWDTRIANGKEKSFGYLRFALGGFGKYIDYALEYYCYFILEIKPKELKE